MSRKSVMAKRQARTDNAIKDYEHEVTKALLQITIEKDASLATLNEMHNKCKSEHAANINKGIAHPDVDAILAMCEQKAVAEYETSFSIIEHYRNTTIVDLAHDLDNTLNHPLFSQDFDPYWRS
jgi:hypothetical protein